MIWFLILLILSLIASQNEIGLIEHMLFNFDKDEFCVITSF